MRAIVTVLLSGCFLLLSKCRPAPPVAFSFSTPVSQLKQGSPVLRLPDNPNDSLYANLYCGGCVYPIYEGRGFKPLWHVDGVASAMADSLIGVIKSSYQFGLISDFHLTELQQPITPLQRDVYLTDSFIKLAHCIRSGANSLLQLDSMVMQSVRRVSEGEDVKVTLASFEPSSVGYQSLKTQLAKVLDSLNNEERSLLRKGGLQPQLKTIYTIMVNMERWRREPQLEHEFAIVNIPSFEMRVVNADIPIITSRVIVGKPETPTPVLSSVIECMVIYPYWNVPRKIVIEEYLPVIQRDTAFIARNQFDVLDRKGNIVQLSKKDWNKLSKDFFPYSLRQREGTENSLGIIKFVFDNPYAVYLHDTNSRRLFAKTDRALSHGCVRVAMAEKFAHFLLTRNVGDDSQLLVKLLREKERKTIQVKPLPIHIRYFTCESQNNGIAYYSDIYHLDEAIFNQLLQ